VSCFLYALLTSRIGTWDEKYASCKANFQEFVVCNEAFFTITFPLKATGLENARGDRPPKHKPMFPVLVVALCAQDRRLDPFQFNLCIWNLEGVDPPFPSPNETLTIRTSQEDAIAKVMYTSMSTCDMFVLPGLRNTTRAQDLLDAMEDNGFDGFRYYPGNDAKRDGTILSRIDLDKPTPVTEAQIAFPIADSTCNCKETNMTALMNLSFYANLTFHDPVPFTHIVSVRFQSGNRPCDCAIREAQAALLCDVQSNFTEATHLYIAGSFEAESSEGYGRLLRGCGLTDTSEYAKKQDRYSRKPNRADQAVLWDTVWVNEAVMKSKYLDLMTVINLPSVETVDLPDITYPLILFVHLPLSRKWRIFEIAFTSVAGPLTVMYFICLLYFAPKLITNPEYISL
jgi:hypothetical protein